ncbi:E3 ubiquitin-protein ligase BRE1B-like [Tachysurus vachellii]|uniref:E3 ubiquitin-protein ligase BRE1B-like n=1 Tax=Tachysurus vachellii TaxID=175792 RepID=UPI00296AEBC3|nr:E3 ubiquitin-protein ligase BRE1B-like [Tachysurus vachellii]XP_060734703.1 E3 ubiquitin-protein ligase BRE1B-like [Tachysurus vachellii]
MPTDTVEWKKVIQDRIQDRIDADPSVQLTETPAISGDLPIINMSGPENHLKHICDIFDQLFNQVQENIQNRAAQRNLVAEIEELNVRIRELEDQLQIPGAEIEGLNVRIRELEDRLQILQRQLSEEVRRNATEDEGAAAQNNPEDDVEELRERIRELELENRRLRGLQDD